MHINKFLLFLLECVGKCLVTKYHKYNCSLIKRNCYCNPANSGYAETATFHKEIKLFQLRDKCQSLHILKIINNCDKFLINKMWLKYFFTMSGLTVLLRMLIEKITKNCPVQKFKVKKEILPQFFSFLAYNFIKYMHAVSFCQKISIEWNRVIHSSYLKKNDLKNTFLKYLLKFMKKLFYQHSMFHFVFLTYIKSSFYLFWIL